jgi:hypothetical protein
MVTDNKINLHKYAMQFGTYMGIYWIVKFFLLLLGFTYSFLFFLFTGLTIVVPFIGYYYARMFRDKIYGGQIKFMQAWVFIFSMYVFAALLVAVAHYTYFRYMDNGFIFDKYMEVLESTLAVPGWERYMEQSKEVIKSIRLMTPIELTIQLLTQNVFYCSILAFITALFVKKTTV